MTYFLRGLESSVFVVVLVLNIGNIPIVLTVNITGGQELVLIYE